MAIHLKINPAELSKFVILPGDPFRAKHIAKNFLTQTKVINEYRGLLSYTGKYKSITVSIVTTGMGCPSCAIVVEELAMLGAKVLIRTGTCGGIQKSVKPGDLIIPDSVIPMVGLLSNYGIDKLPCVPNYYVLQHLVDIIKKVTNKSTPTNKNRYHIGLVCTSDAFYQEKLQAKVWETKGVLCVEMECAGLFALARLRKLYAGAILTCTGNILYGKQVMDTKQIRNSIDKMIEIALETFLSLSVQQKYS